jgi:hypothetical protein
LVASATKKTLKNKRRTQTKTKGLTMINRLNRFALTKVSILPRGFFVPYT